MKRLAIVVLVAGCAQQTPQIEVKRAVSPATAAPHAGKRPRLGWVAWDDDKTLVFCNRRVDDQGRGLGVLGPCKKVTPDKTPKLLVSWLNIDTPDRTAADAGPWAQCSLELEDAKLVPPATPAKLWLVTPTGKRELEAWPPEANLTADAYQYEVSFSPDGAWMAVLRLAIGLGEGERTIELVGAKLHPVPKCP
jgi:hypothetical protein